ncbi:MAG TPA: TolC family protein, partial [Kofleriaceae bacterium]
HNGDLIVARTDIDLADDDVALADSVYAPRFVASARFSKDHELGSTTRLTLDDRVITGSIGLEGKIQSGATYSLAFTVNDERFFSPLLSIFNPAYSNTLSLNVVQPLLRNGGFQTNKLPIVVAGLRRDLSEQQLRAKLEDLVGQVEIAYWQLALAYKERDARTASVKTAQEQVQESTRLVKLGSISDLDVVEAKAGVGRAQQELLRAEQEITASEGRLRLVTLGTGAELSSDPLVPTDDPMIAPIQYALEDHLKSARDSRPDVIAARSQLQAERTAQGVTENALLPQLDLILGGSVIGFAGELDQRSGLADQLVGFGPDPVSLGGEGQGLENLKNGNYLVSAGLRLELPIVNSAARARNDRQAHVVERARLQHETLLREVELQIRNSLQLVRDGEKLEKAADDAVAIETQLLAGVRKRFASGASTSFDVLRVSDQLAQSQIEAARARVNYRLALVRLAISDGTLLESHHVSLK